MNQPQLKQSQQGLTLVEIMVAITISLILMSGVLQIFVSNKQIYRVQESTSRVQENGRFATHIMAQEVRMADFWGCSGSASTVIDHLNPPIAPATNPITPGAGGISGTDDDGLNGSDTIRLQGAFGSGLGVTGHNVNAASFSVASVDHTLDEDKIVLASDCQKADIFQVTNSSPGTNTTVVASTGASTPGNATKPGLSYANGSAMIYETRSIIYSIQAGASGEPALFRSENDVDVELVEGVENMQILYGEDTDNNQTANRYVEADAAGLNMDNVVSVRITLTLRTIEDGLAAVVANGDRRIRRTYTTTVTIRNRV